MAESFWKMTFLLHKYNVIMVTVLSGGLENIEQHPGFLLALYPHWQTLQKRGSHPALPSACEFLVYMVSLKQKKDS